MKKKIICFCMAAVLATLVPEGVALSQNIPSPGNPSCTGEWDPNGQFHSKGERYSAVSGGQTYECVACGGCTPVNSKSAKSGGGTAAFPSGAGASEQFAQQMMVNILGNLLQQAFAPPPDNSAYLQQQAAMEKAKKEAEQREKLAKWQQMEQARAGRQEKESNQLRSMLDVAPLEGGSTGGAFAVVDWGGPAGEFLARGTGRYDTAGLSLMQRLACANGFAQRARASSENGDYVNARYLNEQAENAMAGRNTELECRYDDIPDMPQTADATTADMAAYEQIISQVQQDVKQLQNIKFRLKEIEQEKQDARQQIEKAREEVANINSPPAGAEAETTLPSGDEDSLLLAAQQLLEQAQNDLAALEKDEQDLTGQQAEIENSLKAVQQQFQAAGTGQ